MYVYTHVHMYIHTYIIFIYMYMWLYVYRHVYICVCVYIQTCASIHTYTCVYEITIYGNAYILKILTSQLYFDFEAVFIGFFFAFLFSMFLFPKGNLRSELIH